MKKEKYFEKMPLMPNHIQRIFRIIIALSLFILFPGTTLADPYSEVAQKIPPSGSFTVSPSRLSLASHFSENPGPDFLPERKTEKLGSWGGGSGSGERYLSHEGVALSVFAATLWQQTIETKEMLLLWPTAIFGTIAGGFGLGLLVWEGIIGTDSPLKIEGDGIDDPSRGVTYIAYLVDLRKRSPMTGTVKAKGLGTGQLFEYEWKWLSHRLEYQIVPLGDNDWISLWYAFLKAEPASFKLRLLNLLRLEVGYSTFNTFTRWTDYRSNTSFVSGGGKYSGSQLVMSGHGFEGSGTLYLPLYFTSLIASAEGAYYPGLIYPRQTGINSQFINLIGYNDLREAGYYYWYKYRVQLEIPLNRLLDLIYGVAPKDEGSEWFDRAHWATSKLLAGGEYANLISDKKGVGVSNRGFSVTYHVEF